MQISETDLILNADGSVYHLHLKPKEIADTIIVVGDPERVPLVSKYFDSIEFENHKREFVTHTGFIGKKRVSVISSGIGTDNVEILMNELDALANINLVTRQPNSIHKSLEIIRIGTSGSVQSDVPVDRVVLSEDAIGIDSLNDFYSFAQTDFETDICENLKQNLGLNALPYFAKCSEKLLDKFSDKNNEKFIIGTTLTCPGFYAPQGRSLNYHSKIENLLQKISDFRYENNHISNLEMETAGYYMFSQIFGHQCLSISAILANRTLNRFSQNPEIQVDNLIKSVLAKIS
jgi:uridine phosphorylase